MNFTVEKMSQCLKDPVDCLGTIESNLFWKDIKKDGRELLDEA